jgi:hypothetical protein
MATNAAKARRQRAAARQQRVKKAWGAAKTARTKVTTSTYVCSCGASLPKASDVANHTCPGSGGGKTKTGGGKASGGKAMRSAAQVPSARAARAARAGGHPGFAALVKATRAIAEIDLVDGNGHAAIDSQEFDALFAAFGKALSRAGDNLGEFADRLDQELNLDRRVTQAAHDLADAIGSDARECAKDVRKRLRSAYAAQLRPGSKGPAPGFLP